MSQHPTETNRSAIKALLRSLQFNGVKFLRFASLDATGNIRAKVRPIDSLLKQHSSSLNDQTSIATVCFAGLPYYADMMIPGTGLDAKDVCKIKPDLNSFRILPYAPKTAMVMGYIMNQYSNESSEFCCRAILQRVIQEAADKYNIAFVGQPSARIGEKCSSLLDTHFLLPSTVCRSRNRISFDRCRNERASGCFGICQRGNP